MAFKQKSGGFRDDKGEWLNELRGSAGDFGEAAERVRNGPTGIAGRQSGMHANGQCKGGIGEVVCEQLPGTVGGESSLVFPTSGKSEVGGHRVRRRRHDKPPSSANELFGGETDRLEAVKEFVVRKGIGRDKPEHEGGQWSQFHHSVILCICRRRMVGMGDLPLGQCLHLGKGPLNVFHPLEKRSVLWDPNILEKRTGELLETG